MTNPPGGTLFLKGVPVQRPSRVFWNSLREQCSGTPFGRDLLAGGSLYEVEVHPLRNTVLGLLTSVAFARWWSFKQGTQGVLCRSAFECEVLLVRWVPRQGFKGLLVSSAGGGVPVEGLQFRDLLSS